jgi:hypothetical protein
MGDSWRPLLWVGVAVVLALLLGGGWLVAGINVPVAPVVPVETPDETDGADEPSPLTVTVIPSSVPVGTDTVRVKALCETEDGAVASSPAFSNSDLTQPLPSGGFEGVAELEDALGPGTYEVTVRCDGEQRFGTAKLVVTGIAPTPKRTGPPRTATTWITLAQTESDAWRRHPEAKEAGELRFPSHEHILELKVTHELRVPDGDPDLAALRAGAAAFSPTAFVTERLGLVGLGSNALWPAFGTPVVRMERGSHEAVVTFTGVGYDDFDVGDESVGADSYVGVEFVTPTIDTPSLSAHEIAISATGWTVAGVRGPQPLAQDRHSLRLTGDRSFKAAFVRDGQSQASVAGYLADDDEIGAYIEGRKILPEGVEDPLQAETGFLPRSGSALGLAAGIAAALVLLNSLVRALGGEWWRRGRNWLFLAVLPIVYLVIVAELWTVEITLGIVVIGLPLMAINSARRGVGDAGRVPIVVGAVAATVAGVILSLWGLAVLIGPLPAFWWLVAASILAAVVALVPRWRRALPGVALLVLISGVLLAARAAWGGIVPGIAVWTALLAVAWSVLAFGWTTEASRQWSLRTAALCATAVSVTLYVASYAAVPGEWLPSAWTWVSDDDAGFQVPIVLACFLLLLAFAMLVVRVRRDGRNATAIGSATAFHTALLYLLALRLKPTDMDDFVVIMLLLTWAGVTWLLSGTAPAPVTEEEHRALVRDMIRRRSVRTALTQLLRQGGEPSTFEERRAGLERTGDEQAGHVDSDLALTTLAGRTPWQNALAALTVGTLLSLPFSVVRIIESAGTWQAGGVELLFAVLPLLTLPVLCMVFGYFYPRVRGGDPIAKSGALLIVALLIEAPVYARTLMTATSEDSNVPGAQTPQEALISVLVAVGAIAVVTIGLGLWWEWRLMSLAGEPWARLRNIRTVRALAAPVLAVAIAIGTTAATALVNNVIAPLPTVQAPNVEKSSSATP